MNSPLDKIEETFEINLPEFQTLDEYLDFVLPQVQQFGEDLREQKFYVTPGGKPWMEIRDDPGFQKAMLHFFNEGGEYLTSSDGNVAKGRWRLLDGSNKIIIEQANGVSELFELAFLNSEFFILVKHGQFQNKGKIHYLFMGFEPVVRSLRWRDCVELLFNQYRSRWGAFQWLLIVFALIVIVLVLFIFK